MDNHLEIRGVSHDSLTTMINYHRSLADKQWRMEIALPFQRVDIPVHVSSIQKSIKSIKSVESGRGLRKSLAVAGFRQKCQET